jgi:hypothetical protein
MLNDAFDRLMQEDEGSAIVDMLRPHYSKHSVKTHVLNLKRRVMEAEHRHPDYEESVRPLRKHDGEDEVKQFLDAPLKEQYKIQARHRKFKSWSRAAEAKLQRVKLLPDNIKSLKITEKETQDIKRAVRGKRRERMAQVLQIAKAGDMLDHARSILENATVKTNYAALCSSLALVSGRRATELLNQRSTFTVNGERTVLFSGQLKKTHGQSAAYTIPILIDPKVFASAMRVLRAKQGDVSHLSNEQIQDKYNGSLTPKRITIAFWPGIPKFHFLRTCYAKFCDLLFAHTMTYNFLCSKVLGHADEIESLNYGGASLEDCDHLRRTFGPLRPSTDPLDSGVVA